MDQHRRMKYIFASLLASFVTSPMNVFALPYTSSELDQVKSHLFNNIATSSHAFKKFNSGQEMHSVPGAVLASPSNKGEGFSQDYQFHWTRDAAITMQEVLYLYKEAQGKEKQELYSYLLNYINFEKQAQQAPSHAGEQTLGQPKFNIDATVWEGEWGRPQNDGPGLRASTLIGIANIFIEEGREVWVRQNILDMITLDLDYLVSQWKSVNYCLWEEVYDVDHFFHKMVQRKAMVDASALFKKLGNEHRAFMYARVAQDLTQSLEYHWSEGRGYFSETVKQTYFKGGGLNTSILLGVLYGNLHQLNDGFSIANDRVMSSVFYLRNLFAGIYRLNFDHPKDAPLLGRYGNDIYDGDSFEYGNPWVLISHAMAEYYYTLARHYLDVGKINISQRNILFFQQIKVDLVKKPGEISGVNQKPQFDAIIRALIEEGDRYLVAVKQYAECYADAGCLHFAEQIDRASGKPRSAKDLTWGYTSLLYALQARNHLELN